MTVMYNPKMIRQFEMHERMELDHVQWLTKNIVFKCYCVKCRVKRSRVEFFILVAKEFGFRWKPEMLMEVGKHDRKNPIGRMIKR